MGSEANQLASYRAPVSPTGSQNAIALFSRARHRNLLAFQGYVAAAVANVYLTDRFGFGKVMLFGTSESLFREKFPTNLLVA